MPSTAAIGSEQLDDIRRQMSAACNLPATSGRWLYCLIDPETDVIRYIGVAQNPTCRFGSHISCAYRRQMPVQRWIDDLIQSGKSPRMHLMGRVQSMTIGGIDHKTFGSVIETRLIREARECKQFRGLPCDLLNVHPIA